jgi:hypothetical protein
MTDDREIKDMPSQPHEEREKVSSEDDAKRHHDLDATRNMSFSLQKEAQEYERKKANALLANALRSLSHAQLWKMGKSYALGTRDHRVLD